MKLLGLDCGPPRLPIQALTSQELDAFKKELDAIGLTGAANKQRRPEVTRHSRLACSGRSTLTKLIAGLSLQWQGVNNSD